MNDKRLAQELDEVSLTLYRLSQKLQALAWKLDPKLQRDFEKET